MKRLRYEILTSNEELISSYEEIMAAAMTKVEELVCDYRYLLKRGWKTVIKISGHDGAEVVLVLQSNHGGGSFAEVKMATLENIHTERAATGGDDISDIEKLINEHDLQDTELGHEICEMLSSDNLSRRHHEWLKNNLDYTNFEGAIRMPYQVLSARLNEQDTPQDGEIRIAFSGATQEQDVMFAMQVTRIIQAALAESFPKEQFWFNLRGLQEIPTTRLWIDLLHMREAFSSSSL